MENPSHPFISAAAVDDCLLSEEYCQNFILQTPPSLCPYADNSSISEGGGPLSTHVPPPVFAHAQVHETLNREIYVHNLSAETAPDKLLDCFKRFEGFIQLISCWNRRHPTKGFASVRFDSAEGARKVLETPPEELVIDGKQFVCHSALEDCVMDCRLILARH